MSDLVARAAAFAARSHAGQFRKYNNDSYIVHPMRVAGSVSLLPCATDELIAAAWLHDVVEDCGVSNVEIEDRFGGCVNRFVVEVTNRSKLLVGSSRALRKKVDRDRLENVSMEAQSLKCVDRADNINDMTGAPPEFLQLYVSESVELLEVLQRADKVAKDALVAALIRVALGNPPIEEILKRSPYCLGGNSHVAK